MAQLGLRKAFWVKAVIYACHIFNRLPLTTIEGKTPVGKWTRKLVFDYGFLHIFGRLVCFHVTQSKLDPRAKKTIFVGFISNAKG